MLPPQRTGIGTLEQGSRSGVGWGREQGPPRDSSAVWEQRDPCPSARPIELLLPVEPGSAPFAVSPFPPPIDRRARAL